MRGIQNAGGGGVIKGLHGEEITLHEGLGFYAKNFHTAKYLMDPGDVMHPSPVLSV